MVRKILLLYIIFFGYLNSFSQSKVAHIDTYELITTMPEMLEVQKQLEKYSKERQAEIRTMELERNSKLELYSNEAADKNDTENKDRLEEIEGMEENIRLYMNEIYKELQKKEQELTKPIYDKLFKVIQEVGRENGFDYVLDSSKNQGVLLADGEDIIDKVKIKLGF